MIEEDMMELHSQKNREYAKGGNPLGNFMRVSAIKKLYPGFDWASPFGVAIGYLLKQFDAALWMYAQGYEGKIETIDTRLQDVAVNTILARILNLDKPD